MTGKHPNKLHRRRPASRQIRVAQILMESEVNGPGRRAVIWTQGCSKRCKGCFNPEFLPLQGGTLMTPAALYRSIEQGTHHFNTIEGITLSGGEPFDQAEALFPFAEKIVSRGLSLMAFSGYTLEELKSDPVKRQLLNLMDILVDGEYIESLACNRLWRSSFNQTVHLLSPRHRHLASELEKPVQEVEITIEQNRLIVTGFPSVSGSSDLFTTD